VAELAFKAKAGIGGGVVEITEIFDYQQNVLGNNY